MADFDKPYPDDPSKGNARAAFGIATDKNSPESQEHVESKKYKPPIQKLVPGGKMAKLRETVDQKYEEDKAIKQSKELYQNRIEKDRENMLKSKDKDNNKELD